VAEDHAEQEVKYIWKHVMIGREMALKHTGSSKGCCCGMREDHMCQDYKMQLPLILMKHTRIHYVECGPCCTSKFVGGTERTVVAMFLPSEK
jgi:hypothetical protein